MMRSSGRADISIDPGGLLAQYLLQQYGPQAYLQATDGRPAPGQGFFGGIAGVPFGTDAGDSIFGAAMGRHQLQNARLLGNVSTPAVINPNYYLNQVAQGRTTDKATGRSLDGLIQQIQAHQQQGRRRPNLATRTSGLG